MRQILSYGIFKLVSNRIVKINQEFGISKLKICLNRNWQQKLVTLEPKSLKHFVGLFFGPKSISATLIWCVCVRDRERVNEKNCEWEWMCISVCASMCARVCVCACDRERGTRYWEQIKVFLWTKRKKNIFKST